MENMYVENNYILSPGHLFLEAKHQTSMENMYVENNYILSTGHLFLEAKHQTSMKICM